MQFLLLVLLVGHGKTIGLRFEIEAEFVGKNGPESAGDENALEYVVEHTDHKSDEKLLPCVENHKLIRIIQGRIVKKVYVSRKTVLIPGVSDAEHR